MNAIPATLAQQAEQLSESVTRPIPGSRKVFVEGSRPDLRVPMREIGLTRTPTLFGGEDNPPVTVYDCSGPYTDPDVRIDFIAPYLGESRANLYRKMKLTPPQFPHPIKRGNGSFWPFSLVEAYRKGTWKPLPVASEQASS